MQEQQPVQTYNTADTRAITSDMAKAYLNKVYLWMSASLLVTAGMAVYTAQSMEMLTWVSEHMLMVLLGMIGIILVMSFGARALTAGALGVLLMVFAAVQGLIFGPILTAYTQESLGITFACTAGMFGAMALYGAMTTRDLSGMGRTLMMLLFGLIIAGIVNMFWGNGLFDFIASCVGVVVFALFTAYDTQRILQEGLLVTDSNMRSKGAIMGALTLYLDFINLFLYLLRFFGRADD